VTRSLIYALYRDDSDKLYVGKSTSGLRRPLSHGTPSVLRANSHLPLARWIKKHGSYSIALLEACDRSMLNEAECFYIAYFRSLGIPLLNLTDGGEGTLGHHHSEEYKARSSAVRRGRHASPETRAKMSASHRGKTNSDQSRQKISEAKRGKKWNTERRMKFSAARKGCKISRSAIAATAEWNRGKQHSPEWRARISSGRGGSIPPAMFDDVARSVLYRWRIELHLSRRIACALFGISERALRRLETGK